MNNKKTQGITLLVAGVILLIVSLTTDMLGIGNHVGFGLYQTIGMIAGVIVAAIGFVFYSRK